MRINDIMNHSPLRLLGDEMGDIFEPGTFGAVMAGPGVGKTSLMVQLSLYALLSEKYVLHISLNDPVHKVSLWYDEVLRNLSATTRGMQSSEIWEKVLKHRFIMTFQVEGFSVPKLRERLTDLIEQCIFSPQILVIDGLPFDPLAEDVLRQLGELGQDQQLSVWFTIQTPRSISASETPAAILPEGVSARFDRMIYLQPDGKDVRITPLKGLRSGKNPVNLYLDPSTLLIHHRSGKE